ncbi:MAG TPA: hypothetical protein PK357_02245 [Candidatus Pacearchaeota archaeon]|nr:hypothetical protein [Candidatus Pacearchaeota archaeon]
MEKEEYVQTLEKEYQKMIRRIKNNGLAAITGMCIAGGLLVYDTARAISTINTLISNPLLREMQISKENNEKSQEEKIKKELFDKYNQKVIKSRNLEKHATNIALGSGAYLILGMSIPLIVYTKKRKYLEKQLSK